jgi:hypothetical protein
MATRFLVQQQWPKKWGTVAVFRSEVGAAWLSDAATKRPEQSYRLINAKNGAVLAEHTAVLL